MVSILVQQMGLSALQERASHPVNGCDQGDTGQRRREASNPLGSRSGAPDPFELLSIDRPMSIERGGHADVKEGVQSFLEKRSPVFPGKVGPASRRIESEEDVRDVIRLMRLNYDRAVARGQAA